MRKKVMKVCIMPRDEYRKRTIAIAKGEYVPKQDEPQIWFESLQTMSQVLSNENQNLLKAIIRERPDSLKELENITGRKNSNLSRTLKTLARYGIVELPKEKRAVKPIVKVTDFKVEFGLEQTAQ